MGIFRQRHQEGSIAVPTSRERAIDTSREEDRRAREEGDQVEGRLEVWRAHYSRRSTQVRSNIEEGG